MSEPNIRDRLKAVLTNLKSDDFQDIYAAMQKENELRKKSEQDEKRAEELANQGPTQEQLYSRLNLRAARAAAREKTITQHGHRR